MVSSVEQFRIGCAICAKISFETVIQTECSSALVSTTIIAFDYGSESSYPLPFKLNFRQTNSRSSFDGCRQLQKTIETSSCIRVRVASSEGFSLSLFDAYLRPFHYSGSSKPTKKRVRKRKKTKMRRNKLIRVTIHLYNFHKIKTSTFVFVSEFFFKRFNSIYGKGPKYPIRQSHSIGWCSQQFGFRQ